MHQIRAAFINANLNEIILVNFVYEFCIILA